MKLDPRIIKLLPNGCKNLHTNWGSSRACVQTGPALYHVINMNTRTWNCVWHKKNFDNDGQQKSEPKAAKHSLSTRPSSFPNVFQRAAKEIVLYLKNSSNRIIHQIVAKSKQEKSISVIKRILCWARPSSQTNDDGVDDQ